MAYNGNSSKIVSSSFLYSTLQSFYTKIKGLLDNKADKTALNSINPNTISGGYTKNSFYVNTHPENSGAIIPFVNNDIAFLLKRGGSAKIYYDDVETSADISNVFDGSPSYWAIDPTNIKKVVIELTLHKTFTWTNTVYVDFGSAGWRAKSVTIDVINTNNKETEWTNKSTITNNSIGEHKITFSHNNGTGFNKVRFTFSDWATASIFRIACLGLVNYGSSGLRETFLPKDGGSVYGAITPYSNNSIDFGSSSSKWKNVYATTFNGNLSGNASTATTASKASTLDGLTSTVTELNYVDGVTSNIQTQLNGKASSSHTHNYAGSSSAGGIATDSDKLDGLHASSFVKATGRSTINADSDNSTYGRGTLTLQNETNSSKDIYPTLAFCQRGISDANLCMNNREFFRKTSTDSNYYKIYDSGNLTSLPANGGNADTTDGYHAWQMGGWSDNRSVNTTPNDYNAKLEVKGLKSNSSINSPDSSSYSTVLGLRAWHDSTGGDAHEFALTANGQIFQRHGSTTSWGSWNRLYTSKNITYGTSALTPGSSSLATGNIYLQYE